MRPASYSPPVGGIVCLTCSLLSPSAASCSCPIPYTPFRIAQRTYVRLTGHILPTPTARPSPIPLAHITHATALAHRAPLKTAANLNCSEWTI